MKYFLILNLTLFISVYAFSQQAELTLTLTKPDGANASGIVSVSGADTSMQKALENGTVHFVLRQITGLNETAREALFQLYPNPAQRSVHIYFQENNHKDVCFEVYNLTGQKQGTLIPSVQPTLQVKNSPGMLLVRAKKPGEMIDTRRLLTTSKSMTFYLHSKPTNAAEGKSQVKSLNDSDSYTITFEDTTGHLARTTWERNIPVGTHEQIDTVIPWLYSFNIIGGLENTMCTWQDASGNNLHSGIDSTTLQVDTLAQPITIQALLELENYDNDTVVFYQVSSGTHEKTANQVLTTYDHNWNGQVTSSKPGKTVKDGTKIGLILDDDPEDTTWTQTTNQEYNIEQTLYEDETGYTITIQDAPGHEDKTINGTSTGTNNDDITLQGLTYDATIPLHVQSDGEPVQGATITHEEGTTTTGTNGEATINDTDLETNTYNEPLNTYNQTITTDAEGYEEEQTSIQYNHGDNDTQTITLQPTTHEYWIHGNTNAPNTNIKGWKDGEDIFTSTSNNGSYETNHQTSTLEQLVLDSLTANAEGYQKAKITDINMQPGGTQQNLNLEEESQTHTATIETYGPKTATPVTQGTIEITTLKDNQTHTTPIDSDGVTDINITGPYETSDSIRITIKDDQHYTTGTYALLKNGVTAITGKIGSSIGLPEYINHELKTTIDHIDNPEGTYATMFPDSLQNNTNIMESINNPYTNHGVCTWTPTDNQGTLIETITMYNRTDDINNGGQLPQDRIQAQQEALQFYQETARSTTGAGKTLYQTTYTEASGAPDDGTAHAIMFKDDDVNASNGRRYTGPNTFDAMSASTQMSDNLNKMKVEIGEGFGINDTSSGSSAFGYTWDNQGEIYDFSHAGEVVWNTVWTYQPADFKK